MTTGRRAGLVDVGGGALIVVGSLMTWGNFSSFLNIYSASGISLGPGLITALAGAVIVVCGVGSWRGHEGATRVAAVAAAVALLIAGSVGIWLQLGTFPRDGPGWTSFESHGPGLAVVAVGAVLVIALGLAGLVALRTSRQHDRRPGPRGRSA